MTFIADELISDRNASDLYQLPGSGDWITLAEVTSIVALPVRSIGGVNYQASVIIRCDQSRYEIACASDEDARSLRDQIAKDRNAP